MPTDKLSKPRLERLHCILSGHVERGDVPGIVALVSCHGETHVEVIGSMSLGGTPMTRDTIFRIASFSKPITAVAAMILVEDCKLRLDDSVLPWLPELANRRVLRSLDIDPNQMTSDDTVPARRPITVGDLLTFRMGYGSVMAMPGTYPIQRLNRDLQIGGDGLPLPSRMPAGDEWLRRLGSLPWLAQPGERWMYHVSADVLGMLIARVSGKSLGEFMRERLFEPLGMRDTAFEVPADKLDRLTTCYAFNPNSRSLDVFDAPADTAWHPAPPLESGGGGLVSTLDDCSAFANMMLHKGQHRDEQILSRRAIELMTYDQLRPSDREGAEIFFGDFRSWGFGMAVDTRQDEIFRTPGRFGWDGGTGVSAYVDPAQQVIGILLTQRMMDSPQPPRVFNDFWTFAYGAIE